LEEKAKKNTAQALESLISLQPNEVSILNKDGSLTTILAKNVRKGQLIQASPGEKIAVDGKVIQGKSDVDESMLTGEAIPVIKSVNQQVYAGTLNIDGILIYEAEKTGADTLLGSIIKSVRQSQGSKAPIQALTDKISSIFVPIVIFLSIVTFLCWWFFGGSNFLLHALNSALTVLVIACPCALGLAVPTGLMVGIGKAASNGILIKDVSAIELMHHINTIVFDKTGTVTEGIPKVESYIPLKNSELIPSIFYTIQSKSKHPLAKGVCAYLKEKQVATVEIYDISDIPGEGIVCLHLNKIYFAGNEIWFKNKQVYFEKVIAEEIELKKQLGYSVVCFGTENELMAIAFLKDQIRENAFEIIQQLKKEGKEVHLLSGDHQNSVKQIADKLQISHYQYEVKPDEKAKYIKQLQSEGKKVAMTGDGINDSAALAQADVSIAMGTGSDIAIQTAHITLISGAITKIPISFSLSRKIGITIQQNLFWAFIYNLIGIPLAAGVLYPINGFLINPMIAGAAMALSSISVVFNSLRLRI
jgi:Cu2+-exporting ATPase